MTFDRLAWATWWIGTLLIVGSWMNVVSNTIGWIGFGIACASSLSSVVARKYWKLPPNVDDNDEHKSAP